MPPTKKAEIIATPGNIRTLEEAHLAQQKFAAIKEPTYGIYLNPTGTKDYISEEDMALNGITEGNLLIYMKPGVPNPSSESVPSHGEFQSVDAVLDIIAKYGTDATGAASALIAMAHPGISAGATANRLMAMNGVQDRTNKAVRLAWEGIG